jgi:hypothetical protein
MSLMNPDVGAHLHCAKLKTDKPPPAIADTLLEKQHRSGRNAPDKGCDQNSQWNQNGRGEQDAGYVQDPLPCRRRTGPGSRLNGALLI